MSDFNNNENNLDPNKEEFDLNEILDDAVEETAETEEDTVTEDTNVESVVSETVTTAAAASSWIHEFYEWTQCIAIALVIAFVVNAFFFSVVRVDGRSMENTLHNNDRLVVSKFMYKPKFRDIVVVKPEGDDRYLVKRVIGLPGDVIEIDSEAVYVNGEKLDEPYILPTARICGDATYPLTVKEGYIFVMGDNRGNSSDSRFSSVGQIPFDNVYGKAVFRLWPFNVFGGLYGNLK